MSETLTAYVISVALLAALALLVPCIESMVGLLHRGSRKLDTGRVLGSAESRKRHVA